MNDFVNKVKQTIYNELKPEDILLIDNSNLHTKHKSFNPDKFHLKLVIKSKKLKALSL